MARDAIADLDSDELGELFAAPPDEFVSARNALAKRLREDGRAEDGERVRKLRKPTRPAWLVNQLSHRAPDSLGSWAELVEKLREVAEGSVDAEKLRRIAHEEDAALDGLVREAGELAAELRQPASEAVLAKVRETLEAAAVDGEVRSRVLAGTLEREERAASIGFGAVAASKPRARAGSKKADEAKRRKREKAERELADAEGELAEAEREVKTAEQAARRARKRVAAARRKAKG